ncbi:hypothetical protein PQX77_010625 [Marasmius sp. AFHP31]|nr:hypothetical protein PQX77_010625 [Marasmius sp. AFHP31]
MHPSSPQIPVAETVMKSLIQRLRASLLGVARQAIDDVWYHLERFYETVKDGFGDTLKTTHQFLRIQLELLLQRIQHVLREYRKFEAEHPYIVKAAWFAFDVVVFIGVVIALHYAFPGVTVLVLVGFSALGPVAGTLAPILQSTFYGGSTCGLFSILQRISMTGKLGWSAVVALTGLVAAAIGKISRHASKRDW